MVKYIGEEVYECNQNMSMVIYKAIFPNGKIYIGQTRKPFFERKTNHKGQLNKGDDFAFYRAIRKYGFENLKWEIIEQCDTFDELNQRESYWIEKLRTFTGFKDCNGYNSTLGGDQPEKMTNFTVEDLEEFGKDYFSGMNKEDIFDKYNKRNNMNRHQFFEIYNGKIWENFTKIPRRDFSIEPKHSQFTPFQIDKIIERFKECGSTKIIAKEFNSEVKFITNIVVGKNWGNYTGIHNKDFYNQYVRKIDSVNNEDIPKIINFRYKDKMTLSKIKKEYYPNVNISVLSKICNRKEFVEKAGFNFDEVKNMEIEYDKKPKLNYKKVDKIILLNKQGETIKDISKEVGAPESIIQHVLSGKIWGKYTGISSKENKPTCKRKLEESQIFEIIELRKQGTPYKKIKEIYGISDSIINGITSGRIYNEITHIKDNLENNTIDNVTNNK